MSDIKMLHLYSCELDAPTREVTLPTPLMHQDAYADVFRIHVTRGGLDLQLDGMTVRAWLYLAATGETMLLKGSADGSMAMVTLEPECYLFPGYATLAIQLQQGEECRTLIKINLAINRTSSDVVIDPSNVLPTLPELLAQIAAMEQGTAAANAAAEAANTAAANAKEFIVNVTQSEYILDGEREVTADKTFDEIKTAIAAGKTPVVRLKTKNRVDINTLYLYNHAAYSAMFRSDVAKDENERSYVTKCLFVFGGSIVTSTDYINTVPDNGADGQVLIHKGESTYEWRDLNEIADIAPAIIPTATGEVLAVSDSANRPLAGLRLYGKTILTGTPTPAAPVRLSNRGQGNIKATAIGKSFFSVQEETIAGYKDYVLEQPIHKGDYYITAEVTSNDTDTSESYIYFYPASGSAVATPPFARGVKQTKKITLTATVTSIRLLAASTIGTSTGDTCTWKNVMLTLTAADGAEFEAYKNGGAVTAITPDGLPGIPVSSGGNYTDQSGQMWLCDEVDFGRGVKVQRIVRHYLDGSVPPAYGDQNGHMRFGWAGGSFDVAPLDYARPDMQMCNSFKPSITPIQGNDVDGTIATYVTGGIYIRYDAASSVEEMVAYLAENPVEYMYALATPIETPLSASELAAYRAMSSQKPTTTVYNDSGVGMAVDYIADTRNYIDQKLAAIAAATLNT